MSEDLGRMLTEAAEAALRRGDYEPAQRFKKALRQAFPAPCALDPQSKERGGLVKKLIAVAVIAGVLAGLWWIGGR